jgi:hypothetical protein
VRFLASAKGKWSPWPETARSGGFLPPYKGQVVELTGRETARLPQNGQQSISGAGRSAFRPRSGQILWFHLADGTASGGSVYCNASAVS